MSKSQKITKIKSKIKLPEQDLEFKLFDYNVYNEKIEDESESDEEKPKKNVDVNNFKIQMFGINENGETCSIIVNNFRPFFYVKVGDKWTRSIVNGFIDFIKEKIGDYYENSITNYELVDKKKLYGFDSGVTHKFLWIEFKNTIVMNKVKNLWFIINSKGKWSSKLNSFGLKYRNENTFIYESNIPPLLRYFHINKVSPSGWVKLSNKYQVKHYEKETTCKFEFIANEKDIISLSDKESIVPYKICSFDIEASSSHGDFPLPIKDYKKLAVNIVDIFNKYEISDFHDENIEELLKNILFIAFEITKKEDMDDNIFDININDVDIVYPKRKINKKLINSAFNRLIKHKLSESKNIETENIVTLEQMFNLDDDEYTFKSNKSELKNKEVTIIEIIKNNSVDRETKIEEIKKSLNSCFPQLEGDKVTFIGSTFMKYGEEKPYFNHCIALDTCENLGDEYTQIDSYKTESEVLLAWTKLIQKEDPDIIIGYNIFGFDYAFMFNRAKELHCEDDFVLLSRNKEEVCANLNSENSLSLEESKIVIASGEHELKYIKMNGRLQIDLYNYFRRDYNLTSYKLDYVAGYFIGDKVKKMESNGTNTKIYTKNMMGLEENSFIHLEIISHSNEYYKNGAKFKVENINHKDGTFELIGNEIIDEKLSIRWCLAKDDVTPQDIFRMTNEGPKERGVIAKYCIQDCNLVQHLLKKIDVITGYTEMASMCSVPISFLVFRGQGIKLTSYIAKKCREKNTLMPVIEKAENDGGYEGAYVLKPKTGLYIDKPVACVDYSSLYPSSMISENISHDSKVWTKEYDLNGNIIKETGEKDINGNYIYDNIPEYEYVDITYDTFKYVRKTPVSAAVKVKCGTKTCRFAQFPNNEKAIMPSILKELLAARKATRKKIKTEPDEFMKNIYDKRQLGYKVTANSLYGQCGARTSTFYDKDVAASTTATGRKLLIYGKTVIEDVYGDNICNTKKYGQVKTNAEYVYGDTDSVFFTFNLKDMNDEEIKGKKALEITIDLAKEAGELATKFLKGPHDLEYEKTFEPFLLLSKKRYVGMLYEDDPDKCYCKSMGIVLKRRDNADIVKDVYGGIIDILMNEKNINKSIEFLRECLNKLTKKEYPMDKLVVTKSLRSNYKNPNQIAHKVLADRMGVRDPGNKPRSGDRIAYVYIETKNKNALQGDKIETVQFIKDNNLKINYSHYITNQIMKPVEQIFALILDDIPEFKKKLMKYRKYKKEVVAIDKSLDEDVYDKKIDTIRGKYVKELIFDKYLKDIALSQSSMKSLFDFYD